MESKAKFLGHPIHPMLVVFPLGLLVTAVVFDIIHRINGNPTFATVAYWNIAGGIITGVLAAVFGWRDWFAIPSGTRAKNIGLWHGVGNGLLLLIFAAVWLMRRDNPDYVADTLPFILELLALGLGSVTAWLGGELVDRLGVGVDRGANLNAPNSLSGLPASVGDEPSVTARR